MPLTVHNLMGEKAVFMLTRQWAALSVRATSDHLSRRLPRLRTRLGVLRVAPARLRACAPISSLLASTMMTPAKAGHSLAPTRSNAVAQRTSHCRSSGGM